MGKVMVASCRYENPAITNAIKMELPNCVQTVELHKALDTWDWIVRAHIKGIDGDVIIRVHESVHNAEFIKEVANKLRVFC